ncbi:MAG TPA: helix-turn-helix domain-containing protein [Pyrinomonadaceae bacterium]|jgi:DNA-binding NtrC family response regulator|nr:helix-turn-helix domain-containing protein [Pyrinomonadaceae bacterium]
MSTENEISAGDRQDVNLPALVEAVTHQVLKSVAQALISEGAAQAREPASGAEPPDEPAEMSFYEEVRRFEIGLITRALRRARGKQSEAAQLLGLKATTLNEKMKRYQMRGNDKASDSPPPPSDGGDSRSASA